MAIFGFVIYLALRLDVFYEIILAVLDVAGDIADELTDVGEPCLAFD